MLGGGGDHRLLLKLLKLRPLLGGQGFHCRHDGRRHGNVDLGLGLHPETERSQRSILLVLSNASTAEWMKERKDVEEEGCRSSPASARDSRPTCSEFTWTLHSIPPLLPTPPPKKIKFPLNTSCMFVCPGTYISILHLVSYPSHLWCILAMG